MGSDLIRLFSRIGARVRVVSGPPIGSLWVRPAARSGSPRISVDIRRDRFGEYFEIRTGTGMRQELVVMNIAPRTRHLLLLSRQFDRTGKTLAKQKFLCGREERHWFIAAIPEDEPVSTVAGAHTALKPEQIRLREQSLGLSAKKGFRRRNAAFIRQGEWFFLPAPNFQIHPRMVLRREPLTRGVAASLMWLTNVFGRAGKECTSRRGIPPD